MRDLLNWTHLLSWTFSIKLAQFAHLLNTRLQSSIKQQKSWNKCWIQMLNTESVMTETEAVRREDSRGFCGHLRCTSYVFHYITHTRGHRFNTHTAFICISTTTQELDGIVMDLFDEVHQRRSTRQITHGAVNKLDIILANDDLLAAFISYTNISIYESKPCPKMKRTSLNLYLSISILRTAFLNPDVRKECVSLHHSRFTRHASHQNLLILDTFSDHSPVLALFSRKMNPPAPAVGQA